MKPDAHMFVRTMICSGPSTCLSVSTESFFESEGGWFSPSQVT